ncbi:chromosomal replication initiator protein DnaA [Rubrimonas cliftonensis]|uniref:chromosomal replication initiator protein DnaA n=1 Tax=Rubrimonas cliftonensis TaxID=89524 RepID=UPI000B810327
MLKGAHVGDEPGVAWRTACDSLRAKLSPAAHARWVTPLRLVAVEDGVARISAPTRFIADYVTRTYADHIAVALRAARMPIERVAVAAARDADLAPAPAGASPDAAPDAFPEAPGSAQGGRRETGGQDPASAPLDGRFTFDSFVVGKPNELAHAAARRVAEGDAVAYNPVFLHGGVGLGKTHLMHAIGWRLCELHPRKKVLYLSAEQFMYRFIQALRSKDTIGFKQAFRSVDVLMVDDVQFIAGKDGTQEEFFHTFNALIDAGKQIVISADRAPGEIDGLEERIRSRLQWGLVADIHPTTYELRLGILQSKAEAACAAHPGLTVDHKVLTFLAHRIASNVRVLEGALTRLVAFSTLVGRPITLDVANECLADLLKQHDRKITIEEIMRKVADHYCLRLSDMTSARRARAVARPRQVAMYLSKTLTSKSLPEIGRRFGGRDHTTVMHAVRKVEQLAESDAQIAEDVELLRRMLEA